MKANICCYLDFSILFSVGNAAQNSTPTPVDIIKKYDVTKNRNTSLTAPRATKVKATALIGKMTNDPTPHFCIRDSFIVSTFCSIADKA